MTQTLNGTYTSGITLFDPDTTISATGRVTAPGVAVRGAFPGALLNAGTIIAGAGTISGDAGAYLADGSTFTNASTGYVSGLFGVYIIGSGSVSNAGRLIGVGPFGVGATINGVGTVSNDAGGVIWGAVGVRLDGATGSIGNSGTIIGTAGYGALFQVGGTLANSAGGLIDGSGGGVSVGVGVVVNDGTILGRAYYGLRASEGSVTNTGLISSVLAAVDFDAGPGTVINSGSIGSGTGPGVLFRYGGAVTNAATGVITGVEGVHSEGGTATVENRGSIVGSTLGLSFLGGGSVTNYGVIRATGPGGTGVSVAGGGVVFNGPSSVITGSVGVAITGGPGTVLNQGFIGTGGTAGLGPAVLLTDANGTVTNFGLISNDSGGVAIDFQGNGGNVLGLIAGSVIAGAVQAAGTGNSIRLISGFGQGTVSGIGSSVTGFGAIDIYPDANWAIGGTLFDAAITGFDKTDKLDLAGVAADSVSFSANVLSVYGGGTLLGTIGLSGSFSSGDFSLRPDGAGGTDIVLPDVFIGTYANGVQLTADTSTIAGTATVMSTGYGAFTLDPGVRRTLVNAGVVTADGPGVYLAAGGVLDNSGAVTGAVGLVGLGGPTTLVNSGVLTGTGSFAAYLAGGGRATNAASGTISGAVGIALVGGGTVVNNGLIVSTATYIGSGVLLVNGDGLVTNGASGVISGYTSGVGALGGAVTVINDGTIEATSVYGAAVTLVDGGTVTNTLYGVIQGASGIVAQADATVFNEGYILSSQPTGYAVFLRGGGYVSSCNCGVITGDGGVALRTGTVVNEGAIAGFVGNGVLVGYGGRVVNAASASISGGVAGIESSYGFTTVVNAGLIQGGNYGIALAGGGYVTNSASGEIDGTTGVYADFVAAAVVNAGVIAGGVGGFGVDLQAGGTVTNAGTISGGAGGGSVRIDGTNAGRLVLLAGASFVGTAVALGTGGRTLELASSASVGTISGIGTSFTGFGSVVVDAGAQWALAGFNTLTTGVTLTGSGLLEIGGTLEATGAVVAFDGAVTGSGTVGIGAGATVGLGGSVAASQHVVFGAGNGRLGIGVAGSFGATVFGFGAGDAIDFSGIAGGASVSTGLTAGNRLTLTQGGTLLASIQLDPGQDYSGMYFHAASDGSGGTLVTEDGTPCFLRGTMIGVPGGERAVETLRAGELVRTVSGAVRPILWVGRGAARVTAANRCSVGTVVIRAGALGDGVPRRDLHVTRDHAVLVGDVLVPAEHLVNGVSVVWDARVGVVEYHHVELEGHDVLLAEGAPLESFRDGGSVGFGNAGSRAARRVAACRRVVEAGGAVGHAWRAVARRAGVLPAVRLSGDADLHLVVDGRRVGASTVEGEVERFRFEVGGGDVLIGSRTLVPAAHSMGLDRRRLGVAVARIGIVHAGGRRDVALEGLSAGFHAHEGVMRWTRGMGVLPAALFAGIEGGVEVEIVLAARVAYPRDVGVGVERLAA